MPFTSSAERAAHYCLEAQTARPRIAPIVSPKSSLCGSICIRQQKDPRCGQHITSHTRVPSCITQAAYASSFQEDSDGSSLSTQEYSNALSQVSQQTDSSNASISDEQQRPDSPSGMVALMEAWGHLSTRLQQQPSTASASAADSASDESSDDATTQLILSALKLAVRSLSRVPSSTGSTDSSSYDSSSRGTKPAVQRSLALAAALAELYANGLPLDAASIAAGIVADAVDAAALHIRTVQAKLGSEVAGLVHDVLAVRHAPDRAQIYDDANSSALRGWLLTAYDVRAGAIEVVWRWLGLAQLPAQPYQQQLMAMEALTIYCPLGHALGLGVCSTALEDSAFKVLFPSSYASTARQVLPFSGAAAELLARCQVTLQAAAAADSQFNRLAAGVQLLSRTKSLYSIMRKLLRLQDPAAGSRRLGEMYDLLGMRAVVMPRQDLPRAAAEAAAVEACYRLQELAHQQWVPVPGRTKDYIAKPKPNGYQSLHSTLQLQQQQGQQQDSSTSSSTAVVLSYLELQIRTAAMHAAAEGGDAAHAGYKGRLERRQVRHLQQWTTQLQRRLAVPQQQLLLTLPHADSSSSGSSESGFLQPSYSTIVTSSMDSDTDCSSSSSCADLHSDLSMSYQQQQEQQLVEQQPGAAAAAAASLFHHLDLDGDGMLSLYELTELLTELGELNNTSNMLQIQSNMLLASSTAAAAASPQQVASSQLVSQQQAAAVGSLQSTLAPRAAAAAAAAATVAAGRSSAAAYAQQVFESLDANGDGLISMAEFLEFYMANTQQQQQQQGQGVAAAAAARRIAGRQAVFSNHAGGRHQRSSRRQRPPGVSFNSSWHPNSSSSSRRCTQCWARSPVNGAAAAAADSDHTDADNGSSSNSSGMQRPDSAALAAASNGSFRRPVAAADVSSGNGSGSSSSGSDSDADVAGGNGDSSSRNGWQHLADHQQQRQRDEAFQQQLQNELSFEEDEQQQQRWLRQQQRQLPSLLADAAAQRTPQYMLVPMRSSIESDAVALLDRLGQPLQQLEVPCLGPLLITNAPQVFRSADVILDCQTEHYDRLALQFELVKPTGSEQAVLQARNLSRVVRGRLVNSTAQVNGGQTLLEPHRAAVDLLDGDTVEFPELGIGFVVRLQGGKSAGHPATLALQRYCGVYASQQLGLQDLPVQEAVQRLQQQQQRQQPSQWKLDRRQVDLQPQQQQHQQQQQQASQLSAAVDSYPNLETELQQISRLVRSDARAAELALSQLAAAHPAAAGPWFLWAQLAASTRRSWMARDLFRAAAVCQQQQLDQLKQGGAAAAAAAAALQQQQPEGEDPEDASSVTAPTSATSSSSGALVGPAGASAAATAAAAPSSSSTGSRKRSERSPEFRLSSRLVQVLRVWATLEWDQRLFGPARRLWRLGANEAFKYPYDIAAEGGGAVLHAWATAEYERDNVLNARVVIGEALRKCPKDAAVAVLAASIEAAAGEYNAARALFLRAYQLNKADKKLYMYWPKMEGQTGNIDRARLLFQYGLSLYPNNTKILNIYACFEEEQGNVELARELHRRALGIDSSSVTSMHNRVSWADLELRQGNVEEARQLLRDGLDAHPDFPAAMLLLATLERQQGNLDLAEAYARRVQKMGHAFSTAATRELMIIHSLRGEDLLSNNLSRHLSNMEQRQQQKQAGKVHGNESWLSFYQQTASEEERDIIMAARARKQELGLIRQPRFRSRRRSRSSSSSRGENGRGSASRQQQQGDQQQEQQDDQRNSIIDAFDFGAASAATFEPLIGRKSKRS